MSTAEPYTFLDEAWKVVNNLELAAFLSAQGHQLLHSGMDGTEYVWYFDRNDELAEDVVLFTQGEATVEPMALLREHKRLRRPYLDAIERR